MTTGGSNTDLAYSVVQSLVTTIGDTINVSGIVNVLVGIIPVCLAFVAFWWAGRKVARMLFAAFRKGKLRF